MNAQALKDLAQSSTISLSELRSLRNTCALNAEVAGLFDELTDTELNRLIDRLFTIVLESPAEGDECTNARCALQCLCNGANRSGRFAELAWRARPLTVWRALIRDARLRLYSLAALTTLIRVDDAHTRAERSDDSVTQLHLDMLSLWTSEDEQHRSWIAAFFTNCFEDERFMEREFGALGDYQDVCLSVVNALLFAKDVQRTTNVHPENIRFCLDLLATCLDSIGSDADADHTDFDHTDDRLLLLLEILSSAAIIRPTFDQLLHSGTDFAPIDRAVAVLSAVVRSEADSSADDADDRLVAHWRSQSSRRSEVKQASLQLIGHLCSESPANRRRAGDLDALRLALHCARLQESDRPFQVQWAVLAVRHLCLNCPENQQRLFAVDRVPSCVIDSDRLLESLGLRAVVDSVSGQVRLAPLIDRPTDQRSS